MNLLVEKLKNVLSYNSDEDLKSYEKVKNHVLKEHAMMPLEYLSLRKHKVNQMRNKTPKFLGL